MKYYGKSADAVKTIITAFENGNIPNALAQRYIHRNDNIPCNTWSWNNQLLTALNGTNDARGFNQWKQVGRKVKKGEHAFHILIPLVGKKEDPETKEEKRFIYGFKSAPVFRIESTEVFNDALWNEANKVDENAENWLKTLPLLAVAEQWNISVSSFNGKEGSALGKYRFGGLKSIALGVENISTWTHEMIHAADHKNGLDTGNRKNDEIAAELGGAALLECLGYTKEADRGGAWEYIKSWASTTNEKTISICNRLITRICKNVDLILDTALEIKAISKAA